MEKKATCNGCQNELPLDSSGNAITPCKCGAISHTVGIQISDTVNLSVKDSISLKAKDKNYPGKRKIRRELVQGYEVRRDGKGAVQKIRDINRDADTYKEYVEDDETGEVLRDVEEPLSKHIGHGSDKKNRRKK